MNWENITIEQFQKIHDLLESYEKEESTDITEMDKNAELLSIIKNIPVDEIFDLPIDEFIEECKSLLFLARDPVLDIKKEFTIDGVTYDFFPAVEKMKTGQYIDINSALSKSPVDLAFLMSCVYIPRDEKGNKRKYCEGYDSLYVRDIFYENVPITYALGAANFFKEAFRSLSASILRFLNWKLRKALKNEKDVAKKVHIKKAIETVQDSIKGMHGLY